MSRRTHCCRRPSPRTLLLAPHHPRPSLRLSNLSTLLPAQDSTKYQQTSTPEKLARTASNYPQVPTMPVPRSRPFAPRSPSTPRVPALQTSAEELGTYSEGELLDDPEAFETALSSIEPLSDKSLKAIANLARYKPPPDPCKHSQVLRKRAKRHSVLMRYPADPFPEGRSAVLVVLFGSRSGENLNVLLSTRSHTLRTYVSTPWLSRELLETESLMFVSCC